MADSILTPKSYPDFANDAAGSLYRLMYQARATLALLRTRDDIDGDDTLLGVDYQLEAIAEQAETLAGTLGNSMAQYQAAEAKGGAA